MKRLKWGAFLFFIAPLALDAATITLWNFNSNPPDGETDTGTTMPAVGKGTASLVGGTTATFATSTPNDPPANNNSGWNTASYPTQGTGNKTGGVQFNVSTRGYSNIVVSFEQRPSNTASRYYRFQYSVNGTTFVDGPVIQLLAANTFALQTISLGALPGVDNNTNFAFRVVSEFESTATGAGASNYVTTTASGYTVGGSVRFDLVTISGDPLNPDNTPPTLSDIPDQLVFENTPSEPIPFLASDLETPPEALEFTRASSNTNLIPVANIVIAGTGEARTIQFTPALNQFGSAVITVAVTDEYGVSASDSFAVTVVPENIPPAITGIAHQSTLINTPTAAIPFVVADFETELDSLNLQVASSSPTLVPVNGIQLDGAGANRTVTVTPAAGQLGTTLITLTVTDGGGRSTNTSFVLMVIPSAATLLYETFGYRNGSLVTNSAGFWSTHGGIAGQTQVASDQLDVRFSQSEDIDAPLLGGPYTAENNATLYASFSILFTALPTAAGEYLAHFGSSTFRGRVFATPTDAAPGKFRLGIANGTATQSAQITDDLSLSNSYTVVIRYNVGTAISTLWIDPSTEADPSVTASDSITAITIAAFSFRQASGIGNSLIDNLKVGTSFADVVSSGRPTLQIHATGGGIEISWPNTAVDYQLQSNTTLDSTGWSEVLASPAQEGDTLVIRLPGSGEDRFFRLIRP